MFDDSDPLLVAETSKLSPERALGVVLLAILVVTMVLHAGH